MTRIFIIKNNKAAKIFSSAALLFLFGSDLKNKLA